MVEHRDVEFEGLRFDSSWRFRIFLCPTARDETGKQFFLFYFFLSLQTKVELYEEEAEVETDEEVEETVEREVMKDVVQEIKVIL